MAKGGGAGLALGIFGIGAVAYYLLTQQSASAAPGSGAPGAGAPSVPAPAAPGSGAPGAGAPSVPAPPPPECTVDIPCGPGQFCRAGKCTCFHAGEDCSALPSACCAGLHCSSRQHCVPQDMTLLNPGSSVLIQEFPLQSPAYADYVNVAIFTAAPKCGDPLGVNGNDWRINVSYRSTDGKVHQIVQDTRSTGAFSAAQSLGRLDYGQLYVHDNIQSVIIEVSAKSQAIFTGSGWCSAWDSLNLSFL